MQSNNLILSRANCLFSELFCFLARELLSRARLDATDVFASELQDTAELAPAGALAMQFPASQESTATPSQERRVKRVIEFLIWKNSS